ncbi:NFX1-type zinc finger-containing protein 1 [Metarhizium anisopliae]
MHHKSHSNAWEAEMVHALVRHIVRQGAYRSSDIAVLTPYTGQLQKLRTAMRNDFEIVLSDRDQDALDKDGFDGTTLISQEASSESPSTQKKGSLAKKKLSELLRVATVDNFQGEEAKVVIVSLVRSNEARKVGFLRTTNRINVLLSRAQHGMYLIGNTETYTHVKMWQMVIELMRASDSRYLSPMTSLDTAPREDARRLAFGASRTAATCAWRDATRKACTISFRVRSLASGYTSRADMDVRSQLVERTAGNVSCY